MLLNFSPGQPHTARAEEKADDSHWVEGDLAAWKSAVWGILLHCSCRKCQFFLFHTCYFVILHSFTRARHTQDNRQALKWHSKCWSVICEILKKEKHRKYLRAWESICGITIKCTANAVWHRFIKEGQCGCLRLVCLPTRKCPMKQMIRMMERMRKAMPKDIPKTAVLRRKQRKVCF